jgi:hypothetical protein
MQKAQVHEATLVQLVQPVQSAPQVANLELLAIYCRGLSAPRVNRVTAQDSVRSE